MDKKYSVAIYPSADVIAYIKQMKETLAEKIGWFNSKNAVAHITICEFTLAETEIEKIKQRLAKSTAAFSPFSVVLNAFGTYPNGAYFISPSPEAKNNLKPLMKKVQAAMRMTKLIKSNDPHVSIGRKLSPENIAIATTVFKSINQVFVCDQLVLREFDPIQRQFFVLDTFPFNDNAAPELRQGTLF